MRDPARIPIVLEAIRKAWEQHPDMRLGQLVIAATPRPHSCQAVFTMEDDALLQWLANLGKSIPGTKRPTKGEYGYMFEPQLPGEHPNQEFGGEPLDDKQDNPKP